jgi:hypothetical protein
MQQRRDRKPRRFMTSLLAVALAVSALVVPAAASAASVHACCTRVAGEHPVSIKCCRPDERDRTPEPTPPPRAATAPAPDLAVPLPAHAAMVPLNAILGAAVAWFRPLVASPPLYLLHSTLLV